MNHIKIDDNDEKESYEKMIENYNILNLFVNRVSDTYNNWVNNV